MNKQTQSGFGATHWRAFAEFLALPSVVIGSFLLLAVGSYALDHAELFQ